MIVFSAFVPHTPLLIHAIGKERFSALRDTDTAMQKLALHLLKASPDTVVILSSHHAMYRDAFAIDLNERYETSLHEFGDLSKPTVFSGDPALTDAIQRQARRAGHPVSLHTAHALDHGSSVPLMRLCAGNPDIRILPIAYAQDVDRAAHLAFGHLLHDVLHSSPKRIAVIASGDLSHALGPDAPDGDRPEGRWFDSVVQDAVEHMASSTLIEADESKVKLASECALKPLVILFGILEHMKARPEILSYEHPFGVGYLVTEFHVD